MPVKEYDPKELQTTGTASPFAPDASDGPGLTGIEPHQMPHSMNDLGREALKGVGNIGASGMGMLSHAFMHPLDTAGQMLRMTPPGMIADTMRGKPNAADETGESLARHPLETIEQGIGAAGAGEAIGGGIGKLSKFGETMRPSPSTAIVPPAELHARSLMQSILPPEGVTPQTINAAQREAPMVRAFADRTGNPMKTQIEGLKASEGVAQEGLQHFNQHFLDPYKDESVPLTGGISKELGSRATIGQINGRISDINDMMRNSMTRAKSQGAQMSAQEQLGLESEAKGLRSRLYDEISQRTGVDPEEIKGMREGYGGQFTLRNALESAGNSRLERTGRMSQGRTGIDMSPPTLGDLPGRVLNWARGGEQAIADRQFANRIQKFPPQEPGRPMPIQRVDTPEAPPNFPPRPASFFTSQPPLQVPPGEPALNGPLRPAFAPEEGARIREAAQRRADMERQPPPGPPKVWEDKIDEIKQGNRSRRIANAGNQGKE
jgi:hypothetical protein